MAVCYKIIVSCFAVFLPTPLDYTCTSASLDFGWRNICWDLLDFPVDSNWSSSTALEIFISAGCTSCRTSAVRSAVHFSRWPLVSTSTAIRFSYCKKKEHNIHTKYHILKYVDPACIIPCIWSLSWWFLQALWRKGITLWSRPEDEEITAPHGLIRHGCRCFGVCLALWGFQNVISTWSWCC